ncbi:hypothetical protein Egran_04775 [Elaphomyces granulatus]|uniref:Uncharacterized protein n=1 Tax=Elaphomyces granulatus TaxID=519963 RepID=A0A232LTH3_9EURO|nr:hypothetical protein Egran_04775 [Elaphomyces granulatus]
MVSIKIKIFFQSSMLSYDMLPLDLYNLLDRNLFNWAIGTMQPFALFNSPLFRQIWHDLPGVFCKYGSSSSFSRPC